MKYQLQLFAFIFLLVVTLNACKEETPPPSTPTTEISLQLSWTHEYSSAAFYAAAEKGFFAEEGLKVNLIEGGFQEGTYVEPLAEVVSGEVDFGMTSAAGIISARADGQPVVALLTILQRDPYAIISLSDTNINTPQDLIGKKVAVSAGAATNNIITLLTTQGINPEEVEIIPRTDFGIDPLLNGDVDALGGWIINEGVSVQEAGLEPNSMLLSDYGINNYSFVLFTTEKMISERPEVVQKLVNTILKGLKDVIADPTGSVQYILVYDPELDAQAQERRLLATLPLINVPEMPLGSLDVRDWEQIQKGLLDAGVITETVPLEEVYNLSFLEAAE